MHPCLQIPEILHNIFSDLNYHPDALAALARTCWTFHNPASDVLWHEIKDFAVLLKTMPADSWMEEEDAGSGRNRLSFTRPLSSSDWTRFRAYTSRVRSLTVGKADIYTKKWYSEATMINSDVFEVIEKSPPTPALFPNILKLQWECGAPSFARYVHPFIGPNLGYLSLSSLPRNGQARFLISIASAAPRLQTLTLPSSPCFSSMRGLSTICDLPMLKQLEIYVKRMRVGHLTRLATMPTLESLRIETLHAPQNITTQELISRSEATRCFSALLYLNIVGARLSVCSEIIRWLASAQITQIRISMQDSIDAAELKDHLRILPQLLPSLVSIHIDREDIPLAPPSGENAVHPDILKPLLSLKGLRTVVLDTGACFLLEDAHIEEIAAALPELTELVIGRVSYNPTPAVTLSALESLAANCPSMDTIGLVLHASRENVNKKLGRNISNSNVTSLDLGRSTIVASQCAYIAAYLSDLFPELKFIIAWDEEETEITPEDLVYSRAWDKVEDLYFVFAEVRKKEREYWTESGDA
ncbi:hypothetical protein JAAARDRAFT_189414 [Jaapia argillacea MUCL 33604]|uniref:F-box domain-containing protein n=1 Tax=Jaapia argillacea MUCL 33604 TaxID=933084 RepID=A0A067Q794_9AGAM|nr:hypothetical protein JAAARDRAFT_189414 [Jaapia argillacea MUCL 33604]